MEENFGIFTVRAYTAGGGLPVEGAIVRIFGAEEINRNISHSLLTDKDGSTREIQLPAPTRNKSLSPDPTGPAYSLYNVEVDKEGFYSKKIFGSSVFAGVKSLLLVNMIPVSDGGKSDYPRGNVNTVIPENNNL